MSDISNGQVKITNNVSSLMQSILYTSNKSNPIYVSSSLYLLQNDSTKKTTEVKNETNTVQLTEINKDINNDTSTIVLPNNLSEDTLLWFIQDMSYIKKALSKNITTYTITCPIINKDKNIVAFLNGTNTYTLQNNHVQCNSDIVINFLKNQEEYNGLLYNESSPYKMNDNNQISRVINITYKFEPVYNKLHSLGNIDALYSEKLDDLFQLYKCLIMDYHNITNNKNKIQAIITSILSNIQISILIEQDNSITTTTSSDYDFPTPIQNYQDLSANLLVLQDDITNKQVISNLLHYINDKTKYNNISIQSRTDGLNICNLSTTINVNDTSDNIIYDYVVVGGGPSGIMTSYKLSDTYPDKKILLLEKSEYSLQDYIDDSYNNIFEWNNAQNDPKYQYSFNSQDNKSVWLGKGIGGGSLHNGLQYIDQDKVINKNHPEWYNYNNINMVSEVNNIINSVSYSYDVSNSPNEAWYSLKENIDDNSLNNIHSYNNKVYSTDLSTNERLLLGNLVQNNPNITIKLNSGAKRVLYTSSNYVYSIEDFSGVKYYGKQYILTSGAIQTPAILQRSNINCGDHLCDHAGFTILYGKLNTVQETRDVSYSGDETFEVTSNVLGLIFNTSQRYVYYVTGTNVPSEDQNNVLDFTSWISSHPGGASAITKWVNQDYNLVYPSSHSTSRWNSYKSRFTRITNNNVKLGDVINYNDLNDIYKSDTLYNTLFPSQTITETTYVPVNDLGFDSSNIISHLQTRDDNLNWQTYYSTVPGLNQYLILTHAQSTNISCKGSVKIMSNNNENPNVILNHLGNNTNIETNQYVHNLYEAYLKNHTILTNMGYVLLSPQTNITKQYIYNNIGSIYHYFGSCSNIVDDTNKVNDFSNLFIGDLSVLKKPFGGSTTFPALINGFKTALQL